MKLRRLTALACLAVVPALIPSSSFATVDPAKVRVDSGWLRGEVEGRLVRFSGVPYAAPPVGERRWRAPQAPAAWRGVRDATTPGPKCPQLQYPEVVGNEDCLYLDVVKPVRRELLPVVVWLHGGNLASGAGSEYDGARLAAGGDVIVVTVNYRLGALGFLSSPALDSSGSGNYGLLDQAEALRWVQRNARAFGGDGRQVTLAGQSAGARSVCAQLASPGSRGLFQRAILQSGPCTNRVMTKPEADAKGEQAIAKVGCADAADLGECLRRVPADVLVKDLADKGSLFLRPRHDDPWGPVAGTPYLPWQPGDALRRGHAARVPLLVGSTRDEARGAVLGALPDLTADVYATMIRRVFGTEAEAVLGRYPAAKYPSPALALASALTDWGYACPTLSTAKVASRYAPVYSYELLEQTPPMGGVEYGAYHSWDLQFLWDTSIPSSQFPELSPAQERLSAAMIDYWTTFARTGSPGITWPRGQVLGLAADAIAPTPAAASHQCDFWS